MEKSRKMKKLAVIMLAVMVLFGTTQYPVLTVKPGKKILKNANIL